PKLFLYARLSMVLRTATLVTSAVSECQVRPISPTVFGSPLLVNTCSTPAGPGCGLPSTGGSTNRNCGAQNSAAGVYISARVVHARVNLIHETSELVLQ